MKRILLFTAMLFMALGVFAQYVDLGLPSGTKWKTFNEPGFYTYEEAMSKFTYQLPTYEQWGELYGVCDWIWLGDAYKVIGPNGNFIKLPAAGDRTATSLGHVPNNGHYWSATERDSDYAYYLYFNSNKADMSHGYRGSGRSVRLVQD